MRRLCLAALLALACGPAGPGPTQGAPATLELLAPHSPIGLRYGESVAISLRYELDGAARAGVALQVQVAGDLGGGTLSAVRMITDGQGQAGLVLTAGASEASFQIQISAPDAAELDVDVTVTQRAFGEIVVAVDGTGLSQGMQVATVRASLLDHARCAGQAVTPRPPMGVRSQSGKGARAALDFPTLLLQDYAVVARAEDVAGKPLGQGCADLPQAALQATVPATLAVPLEDVYPRLAGPYVLSSRLSLDPPVPPSPAWAGLACPLGPGQVLLDALLQALPPAEMPLASRIVAQRGAPGADGCRPAMRDGSLDQGLAGALAGAAPGSQLGPVAQDVVAIQGGLTLVSLLTVRGAAVGGVVADHVLQQVTFQAPDGTQTYDLDGLPLPVPGATDLLLPLTGDRVDLPMHALTLRLPALWRQAVADLALAPRGVLTPPQGLWLDSVAAAAWKGRAGCDAVEALICGAVGEPCTGRLAPACQDAAQAVAGELAEALADAAEAGLDLGLGGFAFARDPDADLVAQGLQGGQMQALATVGSGDVALSGPIN